MANTITLTDEQMKALQSGQPITIEPPKPTVTKWEPKGGEFSLTNTFQSINFKTDDTVRKAGMRYSTKNQADAAAKALRSYARQIAWLTENNDGWVADWSNLNQNKHYVVYCNENRKFKPTSCYRSQDLATIYMSEANAIKLAQLMNDGIVEF